MVIEMRIVAEGGVVLAGKAHGEIFWGVQNVQ